MWTIGRNGVMVLVGFVVAGLGAYLVNADVVAIRVGGLALMLGGVAVTVYGAYRASVATPREITIPFTSNELPVPEVKAAFDRMGVLVSAESPSEVTGVRSDWGWGQVLTVTAEPGRLRIRSEFADTRVWGAEKNQENVERFRAEWERRAEVEAAAVDPVVHAMSESKVRDLARKSMWGSGFCIVFGLGVLAVVLLLPTQKGASSGGMFTVAGLGIVSLAVGVRGITAAARRLRQGPRR